MKKGFLLGASKTMAVAAAAASPRAPLGPVDNLLGAWSVATQKAGGAKPLRVECDFVTCSQ